MSDGLPWMAVDVQAVARRAEAAARAVFGPTALVDVTFSWQPHATVDEIWRGMARLVGHVDVKVARPCPCPSSFASEQYARLRALLGPEIEHVRVSIESPERQWGPI